MGDAVSVKAFYVCYILRKAFHVRDSGFFNPCLSQTGKKANTDKGVNCGNGGPNKGGEYGKGMTQGYQGSQCGQRAIPQKPSTKHFH